MAQRSFGPYSLLSRPWVYNALRRLVVTRRARRWFADEMLRPTAGASLLDIGCGTAALLDELPADVDYVGFDFNPEYIVAARQRYGERGRFICADVGAEPDGLDDGVFDLVVARGVLHHLDDAQAGQLIATAHRCLRSGGAFVTNDPTHHAGQPRLARLLATLDRGRFVRAPDAYRALVGTRFVQCETHLVTHLLRVPYSHFVMRAIKD